jgi:3-oxoacyl-[acyl-carrier protein] reductase
MRLKDKTAVITGSGDGIGKVTALLFAKEGAKVVISDVNEKAIENTVKEILESGGQAFGVPTDVTKKEDILKLMETAVSEYGTLDILVNNAGITMDTTLLKMSEEAFDRVIDVNLKGVYHCAQAAATVMAEQNGGVILNASSFSGIYGNYGQTNYVASKSAVIGMTKTWAKELGPKGIRVNAVAPGFIVTPMTDKVPAKVLELMRQKCPLKELGRPEDIAYAYLYLASDDAKFVNGAILEVTGGLTL